MDKGNSSSYPHDVNDFSCRQNLPDLQFATRLRRLIPLIVGMVGISLIIIGIAWNYINEVQNNSQEISRELQVADQLSLAENVESGEDVAGMNSVVKKKMIKVDVSGSVMKPGVIETSYDSRIQDVLISAGGLSPKADRNYVSRNINLAQRVTDGSKVYVPATGENSSSPIGSATSKLINLNGGAESELESLPGVGSVTAAKIVEGRPYQDISDLVDKKIISAGTYQKIKDKVSVY